MEGRAAKTRPLYDHLQSDPAIAFTIETAALLDKSVRDAKTPSYASLLRYPERLSSNANTQVDNTYLNSALPFPDMTTW